MFVLLILTSVLCLTVGSGLTFAAQRRRAAETLGILLIIAGLAIVGFEIAMFDPTLHRDDDLSAQDQAAR